MSKVNDWIENRHQLNEKLLSNDHKGIKRFFRLDGAAYEDGALDSKTKEMIGLACSMVLRCDDCINYHILQCIKFGVSGDELLEAMNVALVVGGSIVIPHMRRAYEFWEEAASKTTD